MTAFSVRLRDLGRVLGLDQKDLRISLTGDRAPSGEAEEGWLLRISRCEPPHRTSFVLEEVDVELADGGRLELLLKHLDPGALHERSAEVEPDFLLDPAREIEVYRRILSPRRLGPILHGSIADPIGGRFRLLIERVHGRALHQIGEFEAWEAAAQWLARFHLEMVREGPTSLAEDAHLVRYDRSFYLRWVERARTFLAEGTAGGRGSRAARAVEHLARGYPRAVERLLALPPTVVHGRFYATNVLVQEQTNGGDVRVVPVDWESAGVAPGLVDLAGLTAGPWPEPEKRRLALAYRREWIARGGEGWFDQEAFLEALDFCRLHCAVQWLGWSRDCDPPREHGHDRLNEALRLAARLGVVDRVPSAFSGRRERRRASAREREGE